MTYIDYLTCGLCNHNYSMITEFDQIGDIWINGHYLTVCLDCEEEQRETGKTVTYRKLREYEND